MQVDLWLALMGDDSLVVVRGTDHDAAGDEAEIQTGQLAADLVRVPEALADNASRLTAEERHHLADSLLAPPTRAVRKRRQELVAERWIRRELAKAGPLDPKREAKIAAILAYAFDDWRQPPKAVWAQGH